MQDNISDQKLAEEMLKLAVDDASSVATRAVSENAMTRGRVDKLRDEMLATVSGEADKRADSVAAIRSLLAANAKDIHAELTQLAGEIQVQIPPQTYFFLWLYVFSCNVQVHASGSLTWCLNGLISWGAGQGVQRFCPPRMIVPLE